MYVIIVAGSLPTLPPLFQQCLHTYRIYKQRSSRGYHSYHHGIELQGQGGKHTIGSMPGPLGRNDRRGSDQDILATDTGGITKTVDINLTSTESAETKPWEKWDSEDSIKRRVEGGEIV